tara:strand:+ start:13860 stop:14090 length:231 start_codon:yes stop_codon:yes gene_type:complete
VVQKVETGVEWLEKTPEQGHSGAQHALGDHYHRTKEYEKSVSYLEKSAAQDFTAAQFRLGLYYADGIGVTKNVKTS